MLQPYRVLLTESTMAVSYNHIFKCIILYKICMYRRSSEPKECHYVDNEA